MSKEECEKALDDVVGKSGVLNNCCGYIGQCLKSGICKFDGVTDDCDDYNCFNTLKQLIHEHFELIDLIKKWGLEDLSFKELDEWRDRCIWHVKECDKLNDELKKVNDYYFKLEKAIEHLFGMSSDDVMEIYDCTGAGCVRYSA